MNNTEPMSVEIRAISHQSTNARVFELLRSKLTPNMRIADIGAGEGFFSQLAGKYMESEFSTLPSEAIFPSDVFPDLFRYPDARCLKITPDGRLPYDDDSVDIACTLEVVEHVEDQFLFARELFRILRPGGTAILSTPNVLNVNSRWRNMHSGFPVLFDPLMLSSSDPVHTSGHIHPVTYYYLAYQLRRAGFSRTEVTYDRHKSSARFLLVFFLPFIAVGNLLLRSRLFQKKARVMEENGQILRDLWSIPMLTSRSIIVLATK
jgi:SAM-dependent methyltransferase